MGSDREYKPDEICGFAKAAKTKRRLLSVLKYMAQTGLGAEDNNLLKVLIWDLCRREDSPFLAWQKQAAKALLEKYRYRGGRSGNRKKQAGE